MRKTESITFSARSFFLSLCSLPFFILFISFFLISAEKKKMAPTRKPWHWPTTQEPSNLAKIWESGNILIKNNQTGFRLITQVSFLTRETMLCRALPHSGLGTDSQDTRPGGAAGQTPGATGSPRPALPTPTSEPSPAAEL